MDTENYLQIMIDSLVQKEELLKQIVDYNEKTAGNYYGSRI